MSIALIKTLTISIVLTIVLMGIAVILQSYRNKDLSYRCSVAQGMPYSKGWHPEVSCNYTASIGFPLIFSHLEGGSFGVVFDPPKKVYNILALIEDFLVFFIVIAPIVYLVLRPRLKDIQGQT